MPNIKSAKKRVQLAAIRTARNKAIKSNLRTLSKRAVTDAAAGSENTEQSISCLLYTF